MRVLGLDPGMAHKSQGLHHASPSNDAPHSTAELHRVAALGKTKAMALAETNPRTKRRLVCCVIQNEGVLCRGGFETRPYEIRGLASLQFDRSGPLGRFRSLRQNCRFNPK